MADKIPPYHWRAGIGYFPFIPAPGNQAPPAQAPPPPFGFGFGQQPFLIPQQAPVPPQAIPFPAFPFLIPQQQQMAPPPPGFFPGGQAPFGFIIPEAQGAPRVPVPAPWGWPAGWAQGPAPAATGDAAPGNTLEGGLRAGAGFLFTGEPCYLHCIKGGADALASLKRGGVDFEFQIQMVGSLSTVNSVIEKFTKEPKGKTLTQVSEQGDGRWIEVLGIKYKGDDKKGDGTLGSLGWGKAGVGDGVRPPVWVLLH